MITYTLGCNITIHVRQWLFPGGEVGIDIQHARHTMPYEGPGRPIRIDAQVTDSDDIMALLLTVDALRREFMSPLLTLHIPYFPYARQDRVVNPGESLSVAVMANLINSCDFAEVVVADPHSSVTSALIKNLRVITQGTIFSKIHRGQNWDNWIIVAPDQGAAKKCEEFAKDRGAAGVIICDKRRDLATGKIIGMHVVHGITSAKDGNLLVLDDICDGGRTFIELGILLRDLKPAKLELAVTHGIFSKGVDIVSEHYDKVYTTDSWPETSFSVHNPKLVKFSLK